MSGINEILEWKQQYGEIFQVQILDQYYIFRAVGREEYKSIVLMDFDLGTFQEALCFTSVLYPEEDFSIGLAGVPEVLTEHILDVSGLHVNQSKELLDNFRGEMIEFDYQVDCIIHEAFPEYSIEQIQAWSVRKTMYYLSRAEWIVQNLKGVQLDYLDEETLAMMRSQQAAQQAAKPVNPQQQQLFKDAEQYGSNEGPATDFMPTPKPEQKPVPEGGIQTEEELLAMMGVSKSSLANVNEPKPELNWFNYLDELRGEFD